MAETLTLASESTPKAHATTALSHFFIGLMKADGIVTQAEERKVEILIHKFQRGMPASEEETRDRLKELRDDNSTQGMFPIDHLTAGFAAFDKFVESGEALEAHMTTIVEMLDILMEVDGVSDSETLYMDRMRQEFQSRYGVTT
jgi:hypothetical protein